MTPEYAWEIYISQQTPKEFAALTLDRGQSIDDGIADYADALPEMYSDPSIDSGESYALLREYLLDAISPLVSTKDAADWLGLTVSSVQKLAKAGKLAGRQIGRTWVIDREAVMTYTPRERGWPKGKARKAEG